MINKEYAVPISELLNVLVENMNEETLEECITLLEKENSDIKAENIF